MRRNSLSTAQGFLIALVLAVLGAGAWWYFGASSVPPSKPASMHARTVRVSAPVCVADTRRVWSEFGKAEFAASFDDAFDAREKAFRCIAEVLGLPKDASTAFLKATEHDGEKNVRVKNGTRLAALASRDARGTTIVRKDSVVAFRRSPVGKDFIAYAEEWTVAVGNARIMLARVYQCACGGSAWAIMSVTALETPKPKAHVAPSPPPRPRVTLRPAPPEGKCFSFPLGFEGKPLAGYFWFDELEGKSKGEIEDFWQKLLASDCFKVNFAGGFSVKPSYGCDICRFGWRFVGWPPTLSSERHNRADIIITVPGGNARVISFPLWAAVHHDTYCPEDRSQQGYVNPAVTAGQISRGIWNYGSTIEPDYSNQ